MLNRPKKEVKICAAIWLILMLCPFSLSFLLSGRYQDTVKVWLPSEHEMLKNAHLLRQELASDKMAAEITFDNYQAMYTNEKSKVAIAEEGMDQWVLYLHEEEGGRKFYAIVPDECYFHLTKISSSSIDKGGSIVKFYRERDYRAIILPLSVWACVAFFIAMIIATLCGSSTETERKRS